jgi:hypothetical protein
MALDESLADERELCLGRQAMLEAVVERLVGPPEGGHLIAHGCWFGSLDQDARDEVGNGLHLGFAHAKARDLNCPHTQATGAIPVLRSVSGDQVLVGDDISPRQLLRHLQPTTELAHISDHLVGGRVALVRAQDGNATPSAWALRTIWARYSLP